MAVSVPTYTVDDLDGFPDDGNRYELLDGMLLVTPAPERRSSDRREPAAIRLSAALLTTGHAHVVGPGAIGVRPKTQLEPDILVYPTHGRNPTRRDFCRAALTLTPRTARRDRS